MRWIDVQFLNLWPTKLIEEVTAEFFQCFSQDTSLSQTQTYQKSDF